MMEIPEGKWCYFSESQEHYFCPFHVFCTECDEYTWSRCTHPDFGGDELERNAGSYALRSSDCLSAYPNGAVVKIEAKEKG